MGHHHPETLGEGPGFCWSPGPCLVRLLTWGPPQLLQLLPCILGLTDGRIQVSQVGVIRKEGREAGGPGFESLNSLFRAWKWEFLIPRRLKPRPAPPGLSLGLGLSTGPKIRDTGTSLSGFHPCTSCGSPSLPDVIPEHRALSTAGDVPKKGEKGCRCGWVSVLGLGR